MEDLTDSVSLLGSSVDSDSEQESSHLLLDRECTSLDKRLHPVLVVLILIRVLGSHWRFVHALLLSSICLVLCLEAQHIVFLLKISSESSLDKPGIDALLEEVKFNRSCSLTDADVLKTTLGRACHSRRGLLLLHLLALGELTLGKFAGGR